MIDREDLGVNVMCLERSLAISFNVHISALSPNLASQHYVVQGAPNLPNPAHKRNSLLASSRFGETLQFSPNLDDDISTPLLTPAR